MAYIPPPLTFDFGLDNLDSIPLARAAPFVPESAEQIDETRGLAAAHVDVERVTLSRADALALL